MLKKEVVDCIRSGNIQTVQTFIKNAKNVNAETKDGETALMIASQGGNLEIARFLVEKGANVDAAMAQGAQGAQDEA